MNYEIKYTIKNPSSFLRGRCRVTGADSAREAVAAAKKNAIESGKLKAGGEFTYNAQDVKLLTGDNKMLEKLKKTFNLK